MQDQANVAVHPDLEVAPHEIVPLTKPADGLPEVVATQASLDAACAALHAGTGPVAVDAERASGYRYGQRAFLVQLRRAGAGTVLIDPVPLPDLSTVTDALGDAEWVVHAAQQDLPCLAELGMTPPRLFDTEVASRLLGFSRVGLAPVVASLLGFGLAKEHSAVDWSIRPLPVDWLVYAALDVELLVMLRDTLADLLADAGKLTMAAEEFEHIRTMPPPLPRTDPWRRTSGIHVVRNTRALAIVRELWLARDKIARDRDLSPGRVLPDSAIITAATRAPATASELLTLPGFTGKSGRRYGAVWSAAIARARRLSAAELPAKTVAGNGPPPPKSWPDKNAAAAARLAAARQAIATIAADLSVPVENLLQPDLLRRCCWAPPDPLTAHSLKDRLAAGGARPWQIDAVLKPLMTALATVPEPTPAMH